MQVKLKLDLISDYRVVLRNYSSLGQKTTDLLSNKTETNIHSCRFEAFYWIVIHSNLLTLCFIKNSRIPGSLLTILNNLPITSYQNATEKDRLLQNDFINKEHRPS